MIITIFKLFQLLDRKERRGFFKLLLIILLMALLDAIGVASLMPFIGVLSNPELISSNFYLNFIYVNFKFTNQSNFLFTLGLATFFLLIFSLAFKSFATYLQIRFAIMREYSIGKRIIEGYLHQPFSWFLNRNSSDLSKNVLSEVSELIYGGLMPLINLIAHGTVAIVLLSLVTIIDSYLAIFVALFLGIIYGILFKLLSSLLNHIGLERVLSNQERFRSISQAFGAIKEVKLNNSENFFIQRFLNSSATYANGQITAQLAGQLPRFLLEGIAFGGMLLVILYLMKSNQTFSAALPILTLYAFVGYRLMPACQNIYSAFTQLRYVSPALNLVHDDLINPDKLSLESNFNSKYPLSFDKYISLEQIDYYYPNAQLATLNEINLTIQAKSKVGFVGLTGSGKTTIVDIILGLLEPQKGCLVVDGHVLNNNNRRSWQKLIGYVPQQIYLLDDSVLANIAFGVNSKNINQELVEKAAKIANIHDFITSQLPHGYESIVGERGVRLSGGQRQRIGIARAIYHNPKILIFDEATSALDNITENAVLEAIERISTDITIIMIAHRLSTVKNCDQIYVVDSGRIVSTGTYDALIRNSFQFSEMLRKG